MKFRYYLVADTWEVTGTNSEEVAKRAASEDNGFLAIIDAETGKDFGLTLDGANEIYQQSVFPE